MALASFFREHLKRIAAAVVIGILGFCVQVTTAVPRSALELGAARFRLARAPLPEVEGAEKRSERKHVHPSFNKMRTYISGMGASVALNDLDGDGLGNDLCYVDTRTDQVIVAPAPGTPERYKPFALAQEPLFDRSYMAPTNCLPGDFNEDGLLDLLVTYVGRAPLIFFKTGENNYLVRDPFPPAVWNSISAILSDLDGDGHQDLIIGNYFADGVNIYDEREKNPVYFPESFSRASNGGGQHVFRFVTAQGGDEPSVQFEEVTAEAVPEDTNGGWTLAIGAQDLDRDQLPEIYIANDFGPDRLWHNRSTPGKIRFARLEGRGGFFIPGSKVVGRDSFKGMGVDFGDMNGDTLPDFFVSNITSLWGFQESQFVFVSTGQIEKMRDGIAPYVDLSEEMGMSRVGWGWDTRLADFDNDGVLEGLEATGFVRGTKTQWPLYQELGAGNDQLSRYPEIAWPSLRPGDDLAGHDQNAFFTRVGEKWVDVSRDIGFGEEAASRGIATSDVDGDGDLDIAVANVWAPSTFYKNESPSTGAFLGLHLRLPLEPGPTSVIAGHPIGPTRTRAAIGTSAIVHLPDGKKLAAQVDGGNGHTGHRSHDLHFGLGATKTAVKVELAWRDPSGNKQAQTIELEPGWHTVQLAWPQAGGAK